MIAQTIDELQHIALQARDAAGCSPALCVRVTGEIAAGIRNQRFDDGERIERLVEAFAGYYTRARHGHNQSPTAGRRRGTSRPTPNS